jgi:class 3 adenylate cyclase
MNDIAEIKPTSSPYEVLVHLNDRILSGELRTFEALRRYAAPLPENSRTLAILKKAFDLQRKLYWGFFKGIGPDAFPRVWSEVVVPDRTYAFAGDLKRYSSISDIYMGLIDIHGYTRFCHKNRSNMSMLNTLDRMIQEDIPKLAEAVGVVTRRARGDEILLLGASAEEVLETVLRVADYFSRKAKLPEIAGLRAKLDARMPEFRISAGIAGGQKYTPLVITRDGDLSGDIVNTAARLQARADKIAPDRNKILMTSHAYQKVKSRSDRGGRRLLEEVDFFNTGMVEFKGLSLAVYDIVFVEKESHRLAYRECMEELYQALEQGMWKSKIFDDAMKLAVRLATNQPSASSPSQEAPAPPRDMGKGALLGRIKLAQELFRMENYEKAVESFGEIVFDLGLLPLRDDLALEYLGSIQKNYARLVRTFVKNLDREIDAHADAIFAPAELASFQTLRKHHAMYEQAMDVARSRVRARKAVWFRVADETAPALRVVIQSRK